MLRINLLPPYVFDDQKKRNVMILWGACTAVAAIVGVLWIQTSKSAADKAETENTEAKTQLDTYNSKETAIKTEKDRVAVIRTRQEFVKNAMTYNDAWPKAFEEIRNLTSPKVVLDKMVIAGGNVVEITGFAPTELDVARWWMELRKSDLFEKVNFDLPPHPYPGTGGTGATAQTTGFAGAGAGIPGMPGGMGGGMSGMPPGAMGGGMGSMMGAGAGGGANGKAGNGVLEGRPGLIFAGHLVLKKPFNDGKTAPAWGTSSGGAGGGGGGMAGMMGGGFSGGPSGGASGSGGGGGGAAGGSGGGGTPSLGGRKGSEE